MKGKISDWRDRKRDIENSSEFEEGSTDFIGIERLSCFYVLFLLSTFE